MKTINGAAQGMSTGSNRSDVVPVPVLVRRGLDRCWRERPHYRRGNDGEWALYLRTMMRSFEREARWWSVLAEWCYRAGIDGVDVIFGRAAISAEAHAKKSAEQYHQMAAEALALLGGDR